MPDDCSAERPVAPLGNRWANSARSPVILFGPAALRTDEVIIVGLMIVALIWLQVGSASTALEIRNAASRPGRSKTSAPPSS
jgi:hypothetical protein